MPDTFAYYVAAYVAAGLLYGGYVVTLVVRARKVQRDAGPRRPDAR